jgi:mono/diheme cytochrome c family protein
MPVKPTSLLILGSIFFSALPAMATEQDVRESIALGALVFADNCRKCHQIDGYGEEALYPSLHKPALLANKTLLIETVLKGRLRHLEKSDDGTERLMPSLEFLSNSEIAAVIAFISNSWGGEVQIVTPEEVQDAR